MTYFNVKKFAVTVLTAILVTVFFQAHGYTQEQSYASEKVTSMRCDTFTFDGTGSYDPDSSKIDFLWDFGDGHSSTEPIIEHTYLEAGEYQAVLTVTDNTGSECSTSSRRQMVR
ncbi:MAG: PKD domain-containing protein, partial [Candidatus Omnitrophica bacterium]|nr:PKD domain-containing protein [Candidatus Omnitrophota bacterium]